jgi:hypothetical protein
MTALRCRPHDQAPKNHLVPTLTGPGFHTIEPQFVRILGDSWGQRIEWGRGCVDFGGGTPKRRNLGTRLWCWWFLATHCPGVRRWMQCIARIRADFTNMRAVR